MLLRGTPAVLAEAEAALAPDEACQLAGFRVEKRRHDWLLGRLAAKRAGLGLLREGQPLTSLAVAVAPGGAPSLCDAATGAPGPAVSITHSAGCAAALATFGRAGVDLEAQRPMPPGAARFFLTPAEQGWLAGGDWGADGELAAWALKEAAYKALGGAPGALTHLALQPAARGQAATLSHAGVDLRGRWAMAGGFCLAIAWVGPGPRILEDLALEAALASL